MKTIITGAIRSPNTVRLYNNAYSIFSALSKTLPEVDETLHSVGSFPKIDFARTVGNQGKPEDYILTAAVAGFSIDEINVEVNHKDRTIAISNRANKADSKIDKQIEANGGIDLNYDVWVNEIKRSSFERIITAPDDADLEKIYCNCKDGLLHITIPTLLESKYISKVEITQLT